MRADTLVGALAGGLVVTVVGVRDARACGGCFHQAATPQTTSQDGTVVTDHRMIFSISPTQTTLYDQILFSGSPSDFAWVLPIAGPVSVGLSSDLLFQEIDKSSKTTILAPPYPCRSCPSAGSAGPTQSSGSTSGGSSAPPPAPPPGVTVIAEQVVGPYATVQLHPNSETDTAALTSWLEANGYAIPANIGPIIAAYVNEGFDFLALKLVPGQGVQAMRPVSVTSPGAGLSLPLRMVAAGIGPTVGITLWVIASGRYEPENFASFIIDPRTLVWDWSASTSNYATLRTAYEQCLGNAAWQIESSSTGLSNIEYNLMVDDPTASSYAALPASDGGVGLTAVEARTQDLNTLFPGTNYRITRMRADLSKAALATDLVLQASADQSTISTVYQVERWVNASCPCGGATSGSTLADGAGNGLPNFSCVGSNNESGSMTSAGPHSGCSASAAPSAPVGGGLLAALAGLITLAFYRARVR